MPEEGLRNLPEEMFDDDVILEEIETEEVNDNFEQEQMVLNNNNQFTTSTQIPPEVRQEQIQERRKPGRPRKDISSQPTTNRIPIDMEQEITVNASYLKEMISQMDKKGEFHERSTENLLTGILKQMYPGINTLERLPINNTMEKLVQVITPMIPAINRQCYLGHAIPDQNTKPVFRFCKMIIPEYRF